MNTLILRKIKTETADTKTLFFIWKDNFKMQFKAGQYLNLFFKGENFGKAYTISSSPDKQGVAITVKKQKNFSVKLHQMKIDDEILCTGPFGFLTLSEIEENEQKKDIIFLAAGIGITPFFSILSDKEALLSCQQIILFYASKNLENTIFYSELEKISIDKKIDMYHYWSESSNKLTVEKIINKINFLENKIYFICGSLSFVNDLRRDLKKYGVCEDVILTEIF